MNNYLNIRCDKLSCDSNTGLTKECMYGITDSLIEDVKSDAPMCEHLKSEVLRMLEEQSDIDWIDRDCHTCSIRLGCPHSIFSTDMIEPVDTGWFLKNVCIPNHIG